MMGGLGLRKDWSEGNTSKVCEGRDANIFKSWPEFDIKGNL